MEMHVLTIDQPQKAAEFGSGFIERPAEAGEVKCGKLQVMIGKKRPMDTFSHRPNILVIPFQEVGIVRPYCIHLVYSYWGERGEPTAWAYFPQPSLSRFPFRFDEIQPVARTSIPIVSKAPFEQQPVMG